jgi:hypothetical protein
MKVLAELMKVQAPVVSVIKSAELASMNQN